MCDDVSHHDRLNKIFLVADFMKSVDRFKHFIMLL